MNTQQQDRSAAVHATAVDARTPVLLITGFLGSGKTTLINRLLATPALERTLVLVNEFGQVSIDTDLITRRGETMIELSNGCVCCTLIDDLGTTLHGFVDRRLTGELPPFDRVLIETTGLANAGPIIRVIQEDERVVSHFALDKVITTVDAVLGMKNLDLHAESVEQVALADRLGLTKIDLLQTAGGLDTLRQRLHKLNPSAVIVESGGGLPELQALLGGRPVHDVRWPAAIPGAATSDHCGHDHAHDHDHLHNHDHAQHSVARHDAHISSICIVREQPVPRRTLDDFWHKLTDLASPNLLRVKGLVHVVELPNTPLVVQGVQHLFSTPLSLPEWPSEDRRTRIVFIGWNLDRAEIEALLP